MLDIHEDAARHKQIEYIRVDLTLDGIGLVVNGEAGDNYVEGRVIGDDIEPGGVGVVYGRNVERLAIGLQIAEGCLQHRHGEINQSPPGTGILLQNRCRQNSVTTAQVQKITNRMLLRPGNHPHHHVQLGLGQGDAFAHLSQEVVDQ